MGRTKNVSYPSLDSLFEVHQRLRQLCNFLPNADDTEQKLLKEIARAALEKMRELIDRAIKEMS